VHIQWFGQSAFQLTAQDRTLFIDPFGKMEGLTQRGIQWLYPPIVGYKLIYCWLPMNMATITGLR